MKINWQRVMCCNAVILWTALFVFLIDLFAMGRIAKYEEVWWGFCYDLPEKDRFLCMVNYDVVGIVCALAGIVFLTYKLALGYKAWLLWTPVAGLLVGMFVWPIIQSILHIVIRL